MSGRHIPPVYYLAPTETSFEPAAGTPVPPWGRPAGAARDAILASPYAEVYRLAQRWTAGAATAYDAVAEIKRHLRRGPYQYESAVHNYFFPLPAFLFIDRAGYCQQFSGTMALMLRMLGIPTRVVTGFAPGQLEPSTGDYEVRDLDAHSWVEVFFPRVGWVTFDPTPAASPALTQGSDALGHPVIDSQGPNGANATENLRGSKAAGAARRRRWRRRAAAARGRRSDSASWRSSASRRSRARWSSPEGARRCSPAPSPGRRSASSTGRSTDSAGRSRGASPCETSSADSPPADDPPSLATRPRSAPTGSPVRPIRPAHRSVGHCAEASAPAAVCGAGSGP